MDMKSAIFLLRAVVATIRSVIRSSDALIRYGGDEFFLVIPNISQEMFEQKLNEILYHNSYDTDSKKIKYYIYLSVLVL